MLSLQSYLNDPCGTISIPYWKQKRVIVPDNMQIVHERNMPHHAFDDYNDEPFFRLYHDLKNVRQTAISEVEIVQANQAVDEFVQLINASYNDLSVTAEQMEGYQQKGGQAQECLPASFDYGELLCNLIQ